MEILKRISLIIFLLLMAAVYLPIGLWAIIAPAQDALGLELPSFYEAVGLSVISQLGTLNLQEYMAVLTLSLA